MIKPPPINLKTITTVPPAEIIAIEHFMQGAIYAWAKNFPAKPFAVRDLVGGENGDWTGTPLFALYEAYIKHGECDEVAQSHAAQDLGWIVKNLLNNDKRTYVNTKPDDVNHYEWVGSEP